MEKVREATLVAYFALKGKEDSSATARVASLLSKTLTNKGIASDSFAIIPVEEYPSDPANLELAVKERNQLIPVRNSSANIAA